MFNINKFTSELESLALNGRLVEINYRYKYTIATVTVEGVDLQKHLTEIRKFYVDKSNYEDRYIGFGMFKDFLLYDIENRGLCLDIKSFREEDIMPYERYRLCITAYKEIDGDKCGTYQVCVMPNTEFGNWAFERWINQPFYDHKSTYEQYYSMIDKWEKENIPEEVLEWTEKAYYVYGDDNTYHDWVSQNGYIDGTYLPKSYEDWLIEDFFGIEKEM